MGKTSISGYEIFQYWLPRGDLDGNPIIIETHMKHCFGCNVHCEDKGEEDLKSFWNKPHYRLEKAHIIPKSLGGTYEPENIVFLCKSCHEESPDFKDTYPFMLWLTSKRRRCMFGIDVEDFLKQLTLLIDMHNKHQKKKHMFLTMESVLKYVEKAGGIEAVLKSFKEQMGSHGTKHVNSTRAAILITNAKNQIEKQYNDFCNKFIDDAFQQHLDDEFDKYIKKENQD